MSASSVAVEPTESSSEAPPSRPREADALAPDFELDGRYRVVRPLGRGGMGQVYEAEHIRLARRVAIKVLRASIGESADVRKRFEREAQAIAQVDDQHVVKVFDFGLAPGNQLYLVMEYLAGRDLRSILRSDGSLAAPRAARLIHDACLGLSAAHARGVIHRDLKPENLLVVRAGDGRELCKVVDFGLAKLAVSNASDAHTQAGVPFGTLHYMSPEQARGDSDIDGRTDVYGCCAVLYEILTGLRPHRADSAHALLYKIINERPQRADRVVGAFIPSALADLVERGLESTRDRRFASMQALATALEPFIGGRIDAAGDGATVRSMSVHPGAETQPARAAADSRPASGIRGRMRGLAPLLASAAVGGVLTWLAVVERPLSGSGKRPAGATAAATAESNSSPNSTVVALELPLSAPTIRAGAAPSVVSREASVALPRERRSLRLQSSAAASPAPKPSGSSASEFERQNPYE